MDQTITLASQENCTGCGACKAVCPKSAIMFEPDDEGFPSPIILEEQCIHCGLCEKTCPELCAPSFNTIKDSYAAQIKDSDSLLNSSSGGVFYAMASYVLNNHGVVYGCAFDELYNALIIRAESLEQINTIRGSKYVWSDSSDSYSLVKNDLIQGRTVLYTCLPCQAAGLKKYLNKQYDNLYIVDVLCGGAPSPLAFQKYLETITDAKGKKGLDFQFRDKEKFGAGVNITYYINGKKHYESWLKNSYYFAFSSKSRITWRKSCYQCNYKGIDRVSDITIGDYWGVEKYHSKFNPKDGVSVILINTEKGIKLFNLYKESISFEISDPLYVTEKNSLVLNVNDGHTPIPLERDEFFKTLCNDGWKKADKKYLKLRKKMIMKQKVISVFYRFKKGVCLWIK